MRNAESALRAAVSSVGLRSRIAAAARSTPLLLAATTAIFLVPHALASTWKVDADGNWNTGTNWTGGVPTGATPTADFSLATTSARTITLDVDAAVKALSFGGNNNWTLAGAKTLTLNSGQSVSVSGIQANITTNVGGSAGLTKTGDGVLILGNPENTYTGTTIITRGTISINAQGDLGKAPSAVVLGGNTNDADVGTLSYTGGTGSFTRGFVLNKKGGHIDVASGAVLTLTNNITSSGNASNGNGPISFGCNGDVILQGQINTVAGTLTKNGNGTLTLQNENPFSGRTELNFGVIRLENTYALGNTVVSVNRNDGLQFAPGVSYYDTELGIPTGTFYVSGLAGTGNVVLQDTDAGAITLRVGLGTGADSEYQGALSGEGNLVKEGPGTFTLAAASTFSGGTSVSGGRLNVSADGALGSGGVVVADSATLQFSGVTYTDTNGHVSVSIAGGGNLTNGAIQGTGTSNFSGSVVLAADATISVDSGSTLGLSGGIDAGGHRLTVGAGVGNGTLSVTGTGISGTGSGVIVDVGSTLLLGASSTYSGATDISNGTIVVRAGNDQLPTGTTVTLGASGDPSTNGKLVLGDSGGAVTQTISGLLAAGGGIDNRVVGGHSSVSTLTTNIGSPTNNVYTGVLGGSGANENNLALTKTGTGTLTLTNTSTYSGPTKVDVGTLVLNGQLTGTGAVTVASGARLEGTGDGSTTGKAAGAVTVNGTIAPTTVARVGATPGIAGLLTTGAQDWKNGGAYEVDLLSATKNTQTTHADAIANPVATNGDSDQLVMSGLTLESGFTVKVFTAGNPTNFVTDGSSLIYDWVIGRVTGGSSFDASTLGLEVNGFTGPRTEKYHFSLLTLDDTASLGGTAYKDVVLRYDYNAVPEATTLLFGIVGLAPMLLQRRRSRMTADPVPATPAC